MAGTSSTDNTSATSGSSLAKLASTTACRTFALRSIAKNTGASFAASARVTTTCTIVGGSVVPTTLRRAEVLDFTRRPKQTAEVRASTV